MVGSIREIAERLKPTGRAASAQVWLERHPDGWRVRLSLAGAAIMEPAEARRLAAELLDHAEICEGSRW